MAVAGIECVMIVANLCIHDVVAVEIKDSGLAAWAYIRAESYQAIAEIRSDQINTPDRLRMSDACENDACVKYYKHCETAGTVTCHYYFNRLSDESNSYLSITGSTLALVDQAAGKFGAIAERKNGKLGEIPLAKFTVASTLASPPVCRRRSPKVPCSSAAK